MSNFITGRPILRDLFADGFKKIVSSTLFLSIYFVWSIFHFHFFLVTGHMKGKLYSIIQVNISFVLSAFLYEIFLLTRGQRENVICVNPKLA